MLTRRLIAVLAIACGCAFAQSQEPPPSGGVTSQPQETQPTSPQQPTADNQQRASQPPIIVNVLPATKTKEEAADERRERREKAELDRRLVDWTYQLAFFTAGLFVATIALFIATSASAISLIASPATCGLPSPLRKPRTKSVGRTWSPAEERGVRLKMLDSSIPLPSRKRA